MYGSRVRVPPESQTNCSRGGIGRRARLRIWSRNGVRVRVPPRAHYSNNSLNLNKLDEYCDMNGDKKSAAGSANLMRLAFQNRSC